MKKKFTLLMMLAFLGLNIGALRAQGTTNWGGSGAESDPYTISNAAGLVELATNVNAGTTYAGSYFKLTDNIDLSSVCGEGVGNWTPIGVSSHPFKGVFDGGNHTISNLYIKFESDYVYYQALFGYVANCEIKNLTIGSSYVHADRQIGLLCGRMEGGTISNCIIDEHSKVIGDRSVGGICGQATGTCSFVGCYNYGNIVADAYDDEKNREADGCGGILGYYSFGLVEMRSCYNYGLIEADIIDVGGIAGLFSQLSSGSLIDNCHNIGTLRGTYLFGGICGKLLGDGTVTHIANCSNSGLVEVESCAGGICGSMEDATMSNCYNLGAIEGMMVGGLCGEMSRSEIEYSFNLGTIKGVIVDPEDSPVAEAAGLVGWTNNGSNLTDCYNAGLVQGIGIAGGLVSWIEDDEDDEPSTFNRCYNIAPVLCEEVSFEPGKYGNDKSFEVNGRFGRLSEHFNISGSAKQVITVNFAGGLLGMTDADPTITNCYYDKQMCTAPNAYYMMDEETGEFSGVSGADYQKLTTEMVGEELMSVLGTTAWTYYPSSERDGEVDCTALYPQLKVFAESENVQDVTASLVSVTPAFLANGENVEGVATDFTVGIDNDVVWSHVSGDEVLDFQDEGYVSLLDPGTEMVAVSKEGISKYIQMTTDIPCWDGSGTEDDPYQLVNASDLVCLAEKVNAGEHYAGVYFKMMNNIDLSSVCGEGVGNWTPIGYEPVDIYDSEDNFFSGVFDGNGRTISNLYIDNNVWHAYAALFGYVSEGTIKNLTVAGSVTATYAAGIVAGLVSGDISNCYNMAEIEGGCAGGIFAMAGEGSVVENCQNSGHIVGRSPVNVSDRIKGVAGGIGGMLEDAEVRNCCNTGAVQGQSNWSNPTSHFLIGPNSCAGGIVAASYDGKIDLCCNMGPVSEADFNGGICGYYDLYHVTDQSISQCYNLGTVEGNDIISVAAGIVGACGAPDSDIVTDCYNAGIVKGTGAAGGIVGFGNTNISNCYNIGHVSADEVTLTDEPLTIGFAGAIAGGMLGTMVNCYYDKQMCPLENDYYSADNYFNITAHPAVGNNLLTAAMTNGSWVPDGSAYTASAGLYPQLTVFAGQTASLASVTPAFLSEVPEENVDGVATDFTVGIDNGVVWSQADGADVLAFNGAHVTVTGRGAEIVAVTKGDASKLILMKTNKGSWCWEGSGTEADPFKIADAEGLVCLAGNVNAGIPFEGVHFVVTADIDLSDVCGEGVGNWSSIGKVANNFEGIFDGGNHTISYLYINDEYETCAALFGSVSGATIKNLTVAGEINAKKAAGVCVKAKSSNFDHCTNRVVVVAEDAAGVCVKAESTNFDHCTNHAHVVAEAAAGVCYELRGTELSHCLVTNCSNEGDIAVSSGYAGGIIGKAEYVNVSGCSNSGSVEGLYAAGICAYFYDGTEYDEIEESSFITDCHNSGDITASSILYVLYDSYTRERSYAGGIVAYLYGVGTALYGCYNTGSVHATFTYVEEMDIFDYHYRDNAAGGICAYSDASNVYCSYNTGTVGGAVYNGGIVGYSDEASPIVNCFNMGIVEGHDAIGVAGGIAGCCTPRLSNCYNAGIVKTSGAAGGIAAMGTEVVNCYNVGYVSANICEVPGEYYGLVFAGAIGCDVGSITNCYYDKQMCPLEYDYSGHEADGNNLLTEDMVGNELQAVLGTEYWTYGNDEHYPLYPQLKAFAESANEQDVTASLVSATPAFLVNEEDVEGVSTNFTVGTNDGVAWSYESGDNVLRFSGSHVSLLGNGNEMVAVSKDGVNKYIPMTILGVPANLTWVDVVISKPEGFSTSNIDSPEDLAWFISYVNGFNGCDAHRYANGKITADIDMSEHYWVPIGFYCRNITSYTMPYKGSFDGKYHNVDGIRVDWNALNESPVINALSGGKDGNRDSYDYLGMFGLVDGGTISCLNLASATIMAEPEHSMTLGGIVGEMDDGTISRCVSNATVTDNHGYGKGGIVGEASSSSIEDCMSTATLEGYGRMGGIASVAEGGSITNCYADAKFLVRKDDAKEHDDSFDSYVGGLAFVAAYCQIENCYVRLRPDSEYGLTKESDEEHVFGLLLAIEEGSEISYCYVPEGTGYEFVVYSYNEVEQYVRAAEISDIFSSKGDSYYFVVCSDLGDNSFVGADYEMTDHHFGTTAYTSHPSTVVEGKEVIDYDPEDSSWSTEGNHYDSGSGKYYAQLYVSGGYLRCSSEGVLSSSYGSGLGSDRWEIVEVMNGGDFAGFKISNLDYPDYSLAMHYTGTGYELGVYEYNTFKDNPAYDFSLDIFSSHYYSLPTSLYGCGTFSEAVYPYTYSNPKGGNIVTLLNPEEDEMVTSGETTLVDALNNWGLVDYVDNHHYSGYIEVDWGRSGSALNGDYPVHCYYNYTNLTAGDEDRPTAKVVSTPDKTDGIPFRYYSHVGDALAYYNAQANGGIIGVYGSDDMRGAAVQSNDANVDVYVKGISFLSCPKAKVEPYANVTYVSTNALRKSSDWYLSLLQGDDSELTVTSGFMLDNTDHSGQVGGGTDDWHMVSSPLAGVPVGLSYADNEQHAYGSDPVCSWDTSLDGLFPTDAPLGSYDFYAYSEPDYHWINLKQNSASHYHQDDGNAPIAYTNDTELVPGHGYLIALDKEILMQAKGKLNNGNVTVAVTREGAHNKGLNFLGNPYQSSLDFDEFATNTEAGNASLWDGGTYAQSYMVLDADSKGYLTYAVGQSVNPEGLSRYIWSNQGFYIAADNAGTATFTNAMRVIKFDKASYFRGEEQPNYALVNLKATDSEGNRDMLTVELGRPEVGGARKERNVRNGNGLLYSHYQGGDYSVVFTEEGASQVPVWFESREDDTYTMTWSTYNGTFSYLHLIDNLTGADVDMLANAEYRYASASSDYASRFRLVFAYTGIGEEESEGEGQFVFQSGDELVVTGEGEVDIIDLNGRVIRHSRATGTQTAIAMPAVARGIYMVRLTSANGVKVNKIVVR